MRPWRRDQPVGFLASTPNPSPTLTLTLTQALPVALTLTPTLTRSPDPNPNPDPNPSSWAFSLLRYWLKAVFVPVNRKFSVLQVRS